MDPVLHVVDEKELDHLVPPSILMELGLCMHIRGPDGHHRRPSVKYGFSFPIFPFSQRLCQQLHIPFSQCLHPHGIRHEDFCHSPMVHSSCIFQHCIEQCRILIQLTASAGLIHFPGSPEQIFQVHPKDSSYHQPRGRKNAETSAHTHRNIENRPGIFP